MATATVSSPSSSSPPSPISYRTLLLNPAILLLLFSRTLDPLATTSIYSYMFTQLHHLSPSASARTLALQAGLLTGSKTLAKCLTGLLWGRLSDRPYGGRKLVLLISLLTSCIATTGYGLSSSFGAAIFWQVFYGSMNNTVGIIRCMVAEMPVVAADERMRARALLMLPLAGSVGQLAGPLVGGLLAARGWEGGVLGRWPFLAPNVVLAVLNAVAFVGCVIFVDETLETFDRGKGSAVWQCWARVRAVVGGRGFDGHGYARVPETEEGGFPLSPQRASEEQGGDDRVEEPREKSSLSFWKIWTPQVTCTLIAHFIIAGHITTFATTWAVFLASPVGDSSTDSGSGSEGSLLRFTGGAGLDPPQIGTLNSAFTAFGIILQTFLPRLNDRHGTVAVWSTALCFFPFAYLVAPYSSYVATHHGHVATWALLSLSTLLFTVGRIGAQPAMTLLINACVPSPDARGTVNIAGTAVGNLSRSIIPVAVMSVYGWGYDNQLVVLGFWVMCALACLAMVASRWVKDNRSNEPKRSAEATDDSGTVR